MMESITNIVLEYCHESFTVYCSKFSPRYITDDDNTDDIIKIGELYFHNFHVADIYIFIDEVRLFNGIDSFFHSVQPESICFGNETIYSFSESQYSCIDKYNYLHLLNF